MATRLPARQRGVSLIEALVALVVMAFGMLAYVGLQSGLRMNGDIAKQRAEAVRFAQEAVESGRGYRLIAADPDESDYAEIATQAAVVIDSKPTNATFRLERTVVDAAMDDDGADIVDAPRLKTLTVDVRWDDRTGLGQSRPPVDGDRRHPARTRRHAGRPGRRHDAVADAGAPPGDPGRGRRRGSTSRFTPPQAPGGAVSWVFDNTTGVITGICSAPDACVAVSALPVERPRALCADRYATDARACRSAAQRAQLPVQVDGRPHLSGGA